MSLHFALIGDTAEQGAAVRVGERRDLIRQVGAVPGLLGLVAGEIDLFEFPGAVLAQLKPAGDLFGAVGHWWLQSPPKAILSAARSPAAGMLGSVSWFDLTFYELRTGSPRTRVAGHERRRRAASDELLTVAGWRRG